MSRRHTAFSFTRRHGAILTLGLVAAVVLSSTSAMAFDLAGYKARHDATLSEVKAKSIADATATMARLDEMIELGKVGAQEYGSQNPKFAPLMAAVIADAAAMQNLTDEEIEDKWGEQGSGGDAVGVPLKSLGQFDTTRAYLELVVSPAHAAIFIKKWQGNHKPSQLDKAQDELEELGTHLQLTK